MSADIQNLPVIPVEHKMSEEELISEFGEDGWYQLEDEIYNRYRFTPMKVEIEEHHVGVYKSKKDNHFKKADHPAYLLRNSLVSPTLLAGIWNASHPRAFLKNFKGICVTDGYQVYHTIEKEREDLRIAGCWTHARRRFDEAVKALPKDKQKNSLAYLALKQIQAIYREENKLASMTTEERLRHRQLTVKPLVDACFAWAKQNLLSVTPKSRTANGLTYSLNQEKYLRTFLEDGEVPMDNNFADQAIRPFCVGKKNWVMIDTIAGAEASAIIYSIAALRSG